MTNEEIKSELINRVDTYLSTNTDRNNTIDGLINRLTGFDKSIEKIDEILNEIISENRINFEDEELKNEFIEFIKPTMFELAKKIVQP
jgi:hypothetical protein